MKMLVSRIEHTNIQGVSKTGKPFHIDNTMVAVSVPFDNADGFGVKEIIYPYGDSSNFQSLKHLRGSLPIECDIQLGAALNSYGNVDTSIISIKPTSLVKGL
jgi:hypothetical protein